MRQILHASIWKFSKLSNSAISLNWSIIDEVPTRDTTAYFFDPLCICFKQLPKNPLNVKSNDHIVRLSKCANQ